MTKVDLKEAYFMVPIQEEDRTFLKFSFKERTYHFKCLPFGLACAPWVFTKTLKPLAAQLRQLGMQLIVYIDDILILAESKELAWDHVIRLVYLLENLGFVISKPKCVLEPTQLVEFLGFSVNSVQQELSLPAGKMKKIRAETWCLLESSQITARKLSQLLGRLQAATRAIPLAPLFYRKLQRACTAERARTIRTGLFSLINPLHRGEGGAGMVVGPSVCLERQDHYDRQTLISDRIRCFNLRLGSILRRGTDWGPLVLRGETVAYQLPGSVGSLSCSEMLCQRQEEHYCATQNGQHHSSRICEQAGWNSVHQTEHHSQGTMALVHEQRCYSGGRASAGSPQLIRLRTKNLE